jgi:hypothetical protein
MNLSMYVYQLDSYTISKTVNSFNNYFLIIADKIIDNNRNDKIGQSNNKTTIIIIIH